jgi:hypothetical protein
MGSQSLMVAEFLRLAPCCVVKAVGCGTDASFVDDCIGLDAVV